MSNGNKHGRCATNLLQRVLQLVEFLLVLEASVHHKQKHRGTEVATGKFILDRRELWQQLSREILFGDVRCVVRRELVSCPSERTGPRLAVIVNCAVWVQDAATAIAADRLILEGPWGVLSLLERGIPIGARVLNQGGQLQGSGRNNAKELAYCQSVTFWRIATYILLTLLQLVQPHV